MVAQRGDMRWHHFQVFVLTTMFVDDVIVALRCFTPKTMSQQLSWVVIPCCSVTHLRASMTSQVSLVALSIAPQIWVYCQPNIVKGRVYRLGHILKGQISHTHSTLMFSNDFLLNLHAVLHDISTTTVIATYFFLWSQCESWFLQKIPSITEWGVQQVSTSVIGPSHGVFSYGLFTFESRPHGWVWGQILL